MAIERLDAVPVPDSFFEQVDVVQIKPKTEWKDGRQSVAVNKDGACGWSVDALVRTDSGVRTISWTVWGVEPTYSGAVRLKAVRAAPWATSAGGSRPKSGLWLSVGEVEPVTTTGAPSRRGTGGEQNAG